MSKLLILLGMLAIRVLSYLIFRLSAISLPRLKDIQMMSIPCHFHPIVPSLLLGLGIDTVKLWDVATRTNIATLEGHTSGVTSVSFSPDGGILASGSWDDTVKLWDMSLYITSPTLSSASDFDGDGTVGFADFLQFVEKFRLSEKDEAYQARFDLNGDGVIGFGDFLIFVNNFGKKVS